MALSALRLQLPRPEGIAGLQRTAVIPLREPAFPLFGGSMGEGVRLRHLPRLPLQPVIADHPRRVQRLFQVAALQQPIDMTRPDARETVGLQFQPHGYRIGLDLRRLPTVFFDLPEKN